MPVPVPVWSGLPGLLVSVPVPVVVPVPPVVEPVAPVVEPVAPAPAPWPVPPVGVFVPAVPVVPVVPPVPVPPAFEPPWLRVLAVTLFPVLVEWIEYDVVDERYGLCIGYGPLICIELAELPPNGLPGAPAPWCVLASAVPAVAKAMQMAPAAVAAAIIDVGTRRGWVGRLCLPMTRLP